MGQASSTDIPKKIPDNLAPILEILWYQKSKDALAGDILLKKPVLCAGEIPYIPSLRVFLLKTGTGNTGGSPDRGKS